MSLTLGLAGWTVYAGSAPVPGTEDFLWLALAWPIAGVLWALTLLTRTKDRTLRVIAWLTIFGSIVTFATFGAPFSVLDVFIGDVGLLVVVFGGASLVLASLYRADPRKRLWYAAPVIVLATVAIVASGLPRSIRFNAAEPALTAYAEQLRTGQTTLPEILDQPVSAGTITIRGARVDAGQVLLITSYVGILGDDEAGLAYVPSGVPVGAGVSDHLRGPWYRWLPY